MIDLFVSLFIAVGYIALMNWLGGEKYLIGNRIRETIKQFKS